MPEQDFPFLDELFSSGGYDPARDLHWDDGEEDLLAEFDMPPASSSASAASIPAPPSWEGVGGGIDLAEFAEFDPSLHPRGQPLNRGQYTKKGTETHGDHSQKLTWRGHLASAIRHGLLAPGNSVKKVLAACQATRQAYREGGVNAVPRLAVKSAYRKAKATYTKLEARYGRKAALCMVGAYLGTYAAYAANPMLMLYLPSPTAAIIGTAEAVRATWKAGKKVLGKDKAKQSSEASFSDDREAMLDDLLSFIRQVSHAAGEEVPHFRRADLLSHLEHLLGQAGKDDKEDDEEADFAFPSGGVPQAGGPWEEQQHSRGQPENRGQFTSGGSGGGGGAGPTQQAGEQQTGPAEQGGQMPSPEQRAAFLARRRAQRAPQIIRQWLDDPGDTTDFHSMSAQQKEALSSGLAAQPGELADLISTFNPWESSDEETHQGRQENAVSAILRRSLEMSPTLARKAVTTENFQDGYIVDLSNATPEQREQADLAMKLVHPSDALTGKAVCLVFTPEGMDPDTFEDYLNTVPGLEQVGHLGGDKEDEALQNLYDLSIAPEQVALEDVPAAARGVSQEDAEIFHADYVATYKRISKDVYVQKDVEPTSRDRKENFAVLPRSEVPEMTGIPKYLLDRSRKRPKKVKEAATEKTTEDVESRRQRAQTKRVKKVPGKKAASAGEGEV